MAELLEDEFLEGQDLPNFRIGNTSGGFQIPDEEEGEDYEEEEEEESPKSKENIDENEAFLARRKEEFSQGNRRNQQGKQGAGNRDKNQSGKSKNQNGNRSNRTQNQGQYAGNVPDVVKQFVTYFDKNLKERNVQEIQSMYETSWNKITEKYFSSTPWPSVDLISSLVEHDHVFLILYKEMYFRHLYGKMLPTLDQRIESWKNYCDLFDYIIGGNAELPLELPKQWLWDMINEFIYQFQSFSMYTSKLRNKSQEEINQLKNNSQVWSAAVVIKYLDGLISKSEIHSVLAEQKTQQNGEVKGPSTLNAIANHSLYRQLGYFAMIGLLRVHIVLADYYLALKTVAPIELFAKGMFTQVSACYISLYYYVGYAYMATRRYVEAIKVFSSILLYINRSKQYHTRSYQYDEIVKKNEKMYSLLALCLSICPQRIDENILSTLREKHNDKMQRILKGEEAPIQELFNHGCPKFVNPAPVNYNTVNSDEAKPYAVSEVSNVQTKLFVKDIKQQVFIPNIRSFLKLYSTIGVTKLSTFLDVTPSVLQSQLMCYKHKSKAVGEQAFSSDIDFFVDQDMVHIIDTKTQRRYSEFFLRHINKFDEIIADLDKNSATSA
eukprot:TRINITY_DN1049_c0_g1_i1.p1 TRINITY_DN1049_c0_g1~~TRINITY_DN1049_c0_g1_i1.p1  ORF type:complete len:607 (-),score=228.50 TRINITY_DN1049_c0_g1_i1:187-2007(-)